MKDEALIRIPVRWHGEVSLQPKYPDERDGTISVVVYEPGWDQCACGGLTPAQARELAAALVAWADGTGR